MRVTLLINRFPPHHGGGYGLRFGDLASGLRRLGNRVSVVTSTAGVEGPVRDEDGVHRILSLKPRTEGPRGIASLVRSTAADARRLRRALRREAPDVILIGNFLGLSAGLWNVLRAWRRPLVLDVSNGWLVDLGTTHGNWFRIWETPSRRLGGGMPKAAVRLAVEAYGGPDLSTRFPGLGASRIYATADHLLETLREAGVAPTVPKSVCRSGIDLTLFPFRPSERPVERLLYVGRLKPTKAPHTAIEALARLPECFRLTIVGLPDDPDYATKLRTLEGADRVTFRAPVLRTALAAVFAEHDALVFPSAWDEPFSRLVLEAMAAGLPVVATPTGGTAEALRHGENGLLFAAEDADELADCVRRLAGDDAARRALIDRARREAVETYELDASVARIESVLRDAVREEAT